MHILKLSEWNSGDCWYVSDVEELGKSSGTWWYISNLLELSPVNYVKTLIDKYHAVVTYYTVEKDVLIFHFKTQTEARKFKNDINKIARDKKFIICN